MMERKEKEMKLCFFSSVEVSLIIFGFGFGFFWVCLVGWVHCTK